jgi:hypothetical protein
VEVHIEDDDGRMQGGKRTAACASEFQKVNNFRGGFDLSHVMSCPHSKTFKYNKNSSLSKIIFNYTDINTIISHVILDIIGEIMIK